MGIGAAIAGSAVLGAFSADKAADAQESAAKSQADVQKYAFDTTTDLLSPYVNRGNTAGQAVNYLLGLGAAPKGYSYTGSPAYQFALDEGLDAVEGSAAASGGLYSGRTLKALQERGQGIASQDYYNNLNALMGVTTMGQNAAAQTGTAASNYATGTSNALANIGNATAAGYTGVANSVNSGVNNALGMYMYKGITG